jgi:hypothetical protein
MFVFLALLQPSALFSVKSEDEPPAALDQNPWPLAPRASGTPMAGSTTRPVYIPFVRAALWYTADNIWLCWSPCQHKPDNCIYPAAAITGAPTLIETAYCQATNTSCTV